MNQSDMSLLIQGIRDLSDEEAKSLIADLGKDGFGNAARANVELIHEEGHDTFIGLLELEEDQVISHIEVWLDRNAQGKQQT